MKRSIWPSSALRLLMAAVILMAVLLSSAAAGVRRRPAVAKSADFCETRCELLYIGCLSGTRQDVCENSRCNCLNKCSIEVQCILQAPVAKGKKKKQ